MSGGGSVRVSFVSVETALCVGPRNDVQSCVTAPAGSGFGLPTSRACAQATPARSGCAINDCNRRRREMGMITVRLTPLLYTLTAMTHLRWMAALAAAVAIQAALPAPVSVQSKP